MMASQVGPHDRYERDPYWTLIEHRRLWIWPLLGLSVAAIAALPFDLELSKWFLLEHAPAFIHKLTAATEPFGNGLGVMFICVAIFLLDKLRRRDLVFVVTSSLGAGIVADLIKMSIARVRPHAYTFDGAVHETFGPWLESTSITSTYQSFPSGHTTTAFGLAMALSLLYPRARVLFFTLAVCVGMFRLCVGAHYLSDVFAGAALGCLVGLICCRIHLWKWRTLGVIAPTPTGASTSVLRLHTEPVHVRASRSLADASGQDARDESSEFAAK